MYPKTVLSVHNYYQQPGGEDRGFANEASLLDRNGHTVTRYTEHNQRIGRGSLGTACGTVWNLPTFRRLGALAKSRRFDLAHFHNTFPLISPAAYYAVRGAGLPVVQTLQNFRLICPGATLMRNGTVCEDCIESRSLRPALEHRCYRASLGATSALVTMITVHKAAGTWQSCVDLYIAVSEFTRTKLIEGGLPAERIVVKPNFVTPDPGVGDGAGGFALFVGRLSEEKGIRTLTRAWHSLSDIPLKVAGDGPLSNTPWPAGVTYLGQQSAGQVSQLMKAASALIFPSIWYECAPMTIVEAFACGLPVVASDLGSLPEFVTPYRTGLLFRPGDPDDLAAKVRWAFHHPDEWRAMRLHARKEYEEKYTAERNYRMLMSIYEMAIENARRAGRVKTA